MATALEHFESAFYWLKAGKKEKALAQLQACLLLDPDYAMAWANRGNLLYELGFSFEALVCLDRAIMHLPDVPELHVNRSSALMDLGCFDKALEAVNVAFDKRPNYDLAISNKALLTYMFRRYEEAESLYRLAIAHPNYIDLPEAHMMLGMCLLTQGKLKEGWTEYEWRENEAFRRETHKPWRGEPLEGKTILVYAEQGHGDAIHFMRYAPILKEVKGGTVYLEVRRTLARLAQTMEGVDGVICFGDELPKIDYAVSMMSLPHWLGTDTVDDIPGYPYLSGAGEREHAWRNKIGGGFKVGLCWAGDSRPEQRTASAVDRRRSITLNDLAPLANDHIKFVSLQIGKHADQVYSPPPGMTIIDCHRDIEDFYDTAALIECLDLVITVDTSVAHVAGALGKPVWLLSRFDGCWRWIGQRMDSPWYPSMRLFHQERWGDWGGVIAEVGRELRYVMEWRKLKAA